ncbi:MAG TPA: extracellular solute-binding protein [Verrucomicrobiae bacterium]|nr:extracellular solute-binding protein [Verrucomicrobiae bacterium]
MGLRPLIGILLAVVFAPAVIRAAEAPKEWAELVKAAEGEKQVNIAGPPGDTFRAALTDAFKKVYPRISVELLGGSGRDKVARILRERQAGLYNWDLYISGPTSALAAFKPVGGFDPFRPMMVLAEVREDKSWIGGIDAGWADVEKKFYYTFGGTLAGDNVTVNWDIVPRGSLKSDEDILDPKWKGKIAMQDPRVEGKGLTDALVLSLAYGENFIRRLFRDQGVVFTGDRRQLVEWIVRGRYPIAIGLNEYFLATFQEKGVGKNVSAFIDPKTAIYWAPGSSGIGVLNRAPHPSAAKVYVNWLLSKAGQTDWIKTETNSRRADVPPFDPATALKPGQTYHNTQNEEMIPTRQKIERIAKEMIQ